MDATHLPAVCPAEIHEALKRDEAAWAALANHDTCEGLAYADCYCGSTLVRVAPCERCDSTGVVEIYRGDDVEREFCHCSHGADAEEQAEYARGEAMIAAAGY